MLIEKHMLTEKHTKSLAEVSQQLIAECKKETALLVEKIVFYTGNRISVSKINELSELGIISPDIYSDVVASLNALSAICDDEPGTLIVPDGVTELADDFFTHSELALSQVLLPESLTSIGERAFAYNTNLLKIIIPKSVQFIACDAFIGCSRLCSIEVAKDNMVYAGSTYLTDKSGTELVYCPENVAFLNDNACESENMFFDGNIRTVSDYAFYQSKFRTIKLPCLRYVGAHAFEKSAELQTLDCGAIEVCGEYAFAECGKLEYVDTSELLRIPDYAFYADKSLKRAVFSTSMIEIRDSAFEQATSLTEISPVYAETVGMNAFNSTSIRRVDLPNCVSLGKTAFANCPCLTEVSFYSEITYIPQGCFFQDDSLESVELTPSVKKIKSYAFALCSRLETIELPSELTTIERFAFARCNSLSQVNIPPKVENISCKAFDSCERLFSFNVDSDNRHYYSEDGVLYAYGENQNGNTLVKYPQGMMRIEPFTVPDNVAGIAYHGIEKQHIDIVIGDSVTSIDEHAFDDSTIYSIYLGAGVKDIEFIKNMNSIESIEVSPDNLLFSSAEGVLYSKNFSTLLRYPSDKEDGLFTLRDEVSQIAHYAFKDAKNLKRIIFNSTPLKIGSFAFLNCEKLRVVDLPPTVNSIGTKALGYRLADMDNNMKQYLHIYDFRINADNGTNAERYYQDYFKEEIGPSEYPFDDEDCDEDYDSDCDESDDNDDMGGLF